MKNVFLLLLLFVVSTHAIDSLKINNTYVDSAVLTAAELNEDNDSCEVWSERLIDTLDIAFPRWTDLNSGDSTFLRLNVDTIGSSPYIENHPTTDTLTLSFIRGNPNIDSAVISKITGGLDVEGATIFNESGSDVDFRIEGDNDSALFFVDAGNDQVIISSNNGAGGLGVKMYVDTKEMLSVYNNGVVVNAGNALGISSFRVEGDGTNNLFKVNAISNLVHIEGPADNTEIFNIVTNADTVLSVSGTKVRVKADTLDVQGIIETDTISDNAGNATAFFSSGKLGIGATPTQFVDIQKDQNSGTICQTKNNTGGTGAYASFKVLSNSCTGSFNAIDDGYTDNTEFADKILLYSDADASALTLNAAGVSAPIQFYTGGSAAANKRMSISNTKLDVDVDTVDVQSLLKTDTLTASFQKSIQGQTYASSSKTISSNTIDISSSPYTVIVLDTEGSAALDTLSTIAPLDIIQIIYLHTLNDSRDVNVIEGGNISLGASPRALTDTDDMLTLYYNSLSNTWCEVSFSDNN